MLLTVQSKNAATALVEGVEERQRGRDWVWEPVAANVTRFPDATRRRVLNSAIRIYGSDRARRGTFTGSGVIFHVDQGKTYILTAAHNLTMWAEIQGLPANWNDYVGDFGRAMTIAYGSDRDMRFNLAPLGNSDKTRNVAQAPPLQTECGGRGNCLYDLLMIESSDAQLRAYAQNFVFGGMSFKNIADLVKSEASTVANQLSDLLDWKFYYHVQLGYGTTTDDRDRESIVNGLITKTTVRKACQNGTNITRNNLQYRVTTPSFKVTRSVFNQEAPAGQAPRYGEFPNAICLRGPMSSTTASGDSGGPLYAVSRDFSDVYLLGVTTGADMWPAQGVSRWVFRSAISTSVAPYLRTLLRANFFGT